MREENDPERASEVDARHSLRTNESEKRRSDHQSRKDEWDQRCCPHQRLARKVKPREHPRRGQAGNHRKKRRQHRLPECEQRNTLEGRVRENLIEYSEAEPAILREPTHRDCDHGIGKEVSEEERRYGDHCRRTETPERAARYERAIAVHSLIHRSRFCSIVPGSMTTDVSGSVV